MDVAEAKETLKTQFAKPYKARAIFDIFDAIQSLYVKEEELEAVIDEIVQAELADRQTLTQYRWVARQFPNDVRDKVSDEQRHLTFSHYRAVSGIEDMNRRVKLLNDAAANGWSI